MEIEWLIDQLKRYPNLQAEDMLKALYQSEFGCAHFTLGEKQGLKHILKELDGLSSAYTPADLVEPIGDRFCRVHLAKIKARGLNPATLARLFFLSSQTKPENQNNFVAKLACFLDCCKKGTLPFDPVYVQTLIAENQKSGSPAIHHSPKFHQLYHPAYRVIRADYGALLPLLCKIDTVMRQKESAIVAIDGNSAAGKTTLSSFLAQVYDANVLHMDHFFLRPSQRTPARLSSPGGNVDYERFLHDVLNPLSKGGSFTFCPYNCKTQSFDDPITVTPKPLRIVEGAYSMHPTLSGNYDVSVFLSLDFASQKSRILLRNGVSMQ
ncbi:MAG: hypothetical protein AB1Z19_05530, partial [Eubacteriales bacterium]